MIPLHRVLVSLSMRWGPSAPKSGTGKATAMALLGSEGELRLPFLLSLPHQRRIYEPDMAVRFLKPRRR